MSLRLVAQIMSNGMILVPLQRKVSLALVMLLATLAVLSSVVLNTVVSPAFTDLELLAAETNLVRARRSIEAELANLSALNYDWSSWDAGYAYAKGENPDFEASNLDTATMLNLRLDLMLYYDADGTMLWGRLLSGDQPDDINKLGLFGVDPQRTDRLLQHDSLTSKVSGLQSSDLGPMLISSIPLLTSIDEGPIAGSMIMGRFLNENLTSRLRAQTEVDFSLHPVSGGNDLLSSEVLMLVAGKNRGKVHKTTDAEISSYIVLRDLAGTPLVVLQANTPRRISALGHRTIMGASLILAIIALIVVFAIWLMLRNLIVRPLESIAAHITAMRESGDLTQRIGRKATDEIGIVAQEFDKMAAEVHAARRLLLDQSFKAGKADMAADVLHNIRNAMTPLINGIERLSHYFRVAGKLRVTAATEQLRSSNCSPERREKLIQYIDSAFEHVKVSGEDAVEGMKVVSTQAHQVEAILADQEKHANVAPVFENFELEDVIDEASLVIPESTGISLELDLGGNPDHLCVYAHRTGLLQVLGNIILNAYESIVRSGSDTGAIQVSATTEAIDDKEMIRLTVSDSGCGFDEQALGKLFQRGYSSKEGDMSGLGLHWCANALAAMDGRISADSPGVGSGAEFHVLLPAAQGG
jgi:sensor domain CHASE-containing protein